MILLWYLFEHVLNISTTYVIAVSSARAEKGAALKGQQHGGG